MKKLQISLFFLAFVAFALTIVPKAQAVIIYTDFTTYNNAWAPLTVENFEDLILQGDLTITSDWGGYIENGVFHDQVSATNSTTFSFSDPQGIKAFGGWWDLAGPGGPGSNIQVNAIDLGNNNISIGEIPNTYAGQFWGFALDPSGTGFKDVVFSKGTNEVVETYYSVDLQYSRIPEPAIMLLLGTCLVGLAGLGRKKLIKK